MRDDPLTFLARTAADLGDVVEFPMPGRPVLFVNDPVAAQRVLRDNYRDYGKRTVQYDALSVVTGQGLLTADHGPWREHRRVQQPAFHQGALEPVVQVAAAAADRVTDRWDRAPEGSVVDVERAMTRIALEVVGRHLFTSDLDGRTSHVADAVAVALDEVLARARHPWNVAAGVPTPGNRRLQRAMDDIDRAVDSLLTARRIAPAGDDLLGLLLSSGLEDREVRDEVVTMLVAGHETVASALTWTWSLLGAHPAEADAVRYEVERVLGGQDRPLRWEHVPSLVRTRQVIDETLRLRPPAWVVTRRALVDDELAGVPIRAGTLVIVGTHALHHRADVWPDPERFDPGRFGGLTTAQRQAYVPFGSGSRMCIGRELALLEMTVVLARLSQRFVLLPTTSAPATPVAGVTLRPRGGLRMRIRRR